MNLREWALPVYTILIELASGALLCLWSIRVIYRSKLKQSTLNEFSRIPGVIIFFTIIIAIFGAHFHLSRPFFSVFAIMNFRTSWLSREIIFTILFLLLSGGLTYLLWFVSGHNRVKNILGWLAVGAGIMTVYAMAQIYLLPTQTLWNSEFTHLSYYSSMMLLGTTSLSAILLMVLNYSAVQENPYVPQFTKIVRGSLFWLSIAAALTMALVFALSIYQIVSLKTVEDPSAQISLQLLLNLYQPLLGLRFGLTLIGVGLLLVSVFRMKSGKRQIQDLIGSVYIAFLFILVGSILGRFLFYAIHVRVGI